MWGFQFLLNLDLWGISFHAAVVFGLGKDFLFKYALGHCDVRLILKSQPETLMINDVNFPLLLSWFCRYVMKK